jgi:hypothetical protein
VLILPTAPVTVGLGLVVRVLVDQVADPCCLVSVFGMIDGISSIKEEEAVEVVKTDVVTVFDTDSLMTPTTQSHPIDSPEEQVEGQFEYSLETQIQGPGQNS